MTDYYWNKLGPKMGQGSRRPDVHRLQPWNMTMMEIRAEAAA